MKKNKAPSRLGEIIRASDAAVLAQLVERLASARPDVRRECLDFLQQHAALASSAKADAEAEAVFALWEELEPDLAELDEYGGGDHNTQDYVGELLYELFTKLKKCHLTSDDRRLLLEKVLPYIRSGNAGMDDALYDVAYAACSDNEDWRYLAQRLEGLGKDWPLDHARRIYRKIGDRDKFLALRSRRMEYGADYHDLATFYWEQDRKSTRLNSSSVRQPSDCRSRATRLSKNSVAPRNGKRLSPVCTPPRRKPGRNSSSRSTCIARNMIRQFAS